MGSKSTPQQSTQQTQTNMGPWEAQQPYLTKLFQQAGSLYDKGPMQYYPDSTVSGFTPAQNQGFQGTLTTAQNQQPIVGQQNQNILDTLQGKYLDPSTNPYLAKTYGQAADAVTRSYQTATAPQTAAAFSQAGRYGSGARNQQVDQNNRNLGTTLDNLATGIYGGNYATERGNQMNTMGNLGPMLQAGYVPSTAAVNVGGAQQGQNQQQLTDQVNRFNFNQQAPWQNLGLYQGAISGNYGQSGTTTSTMTQPSYSNPLGSIFGGLLSAGSLAGQLGWNPFGAAAGAGGGLSALSDERAKENIEPVGMTFDGQNVYRFNYKGNPTPQIGLIAQEVEKKRPDAVTEIDGVKYVDYGKALNAR